MYIASASKIAQITNETIYGAAAKVNAAVAKASGGKVPCYAIKGKRVDFKWVSVGSSAVISRGEAARWLASFGIDIQVVEAA